MKSPPASPLMRILLFSGCLAISAASLLRGGGTILLPYTSNDTQPKSSGTNRSGKGINADGTIAERNTDGDRYPDPINETQPIGAVLLYKQATPGGEPPGGETAKIDFSVLDPDLNASSNFSASIDVVGWAQSGEDQPPINVNSNFDLRNGGPGGDGLGTTGDSLSEFTVNSTSFGSYSFTYSRKDGTPYRHNNTSDKYSEVTDMFPIQITPAPGGIKIWAPVDPGVLWDNYQFTVSGDGFSTTLTNLGGGGYSGSGSFVRCNPGGGAVDVEFKVNHDDHSTQSLQAHSLALPPVTIPADEAAGPRYRKISLLGRPIPDAPPEANAESDEEPEESFVDALTLGLRHSTSDIYIPVPASELVLGVRRNAQTEVWNLRSGLRPAEKLCQPFGPGWNSNLGAHIRIERHVATTRSDPDTATLVDENGSSFTFIMWEVDSGETRFFPMVTGEHEQATYLTKLTRYGSVFVFERRFGTKLTFDLISGETSFSSDRIDGAESYSSYQYARIRTVEDRYGNQLLHSYGNTSFPTVPTQVSVVGREALSINMTLTATGRIASVRDPRQNVLQYTYEAGPGGTGLPGTLLTKMTRPGNNATQSTQYAYNFAVDQDQTPLTDPPRVTQKYHLDLSSIQSPEGKRYDFLYAFDHSKHDYMKIPGAFDGYFVKTGVPRNVISVALPGGLGTTWFTNLSDIRVEMNPLDKVVGTRACQVFDPSGIPTIYTWPVADAKVERLTQFQIYYGVPDEYSHAFNPPRIIFYPTMLIDHPMGGSERFTFDINAGMALKSVTDPWGNTKTYEYAATAPVSDEYALVRGEAGFNLFYPDPTREIDPGGASRDMTYATSFGLLQSTRDEIGRTTDYSFDPYGRRETEIIRSASGNIAKITSFQYHASLKSFVSSESVSGAPSDPNPNHVVTRTPDSLGRVQSQTVGVGRTTNFTYDPNCNRIGQTDGRGKHTTFTYDASNRLIETEFHGGATQTMQFNLDGRKVSEVNEREYETTYQRDALGRVLVESHQNDGVPSITTHQRNVFGAITQTTDPGGGVTTLEYDALGRLVRTVGPGASAPETTYQYGANSGSFALSGWAFKPTQTTNPEGYRQIVAYDSRYRPVIAATEVTLGAGFATTVTTYDDAGQPVVLTSGIGIGGSASPAAPLQTIEFAYDPLGKVSVKTFLDLAPGNVTQKTWYTATGAVRKTENENGAITTTDFNSAMSPIRTEGPAVEGGAPITTYQYDAAGNMVSKTDPTGGIWNYEYDDRNRLVVERSPTVPSLAGNIRPTTTTEYDDVGNVVAVIDARGGRTDTTFDGLNRATTARRPQISYRNDQGATLQGRPGTETVYDTRGNPAQVYLTMNGTRVRCDASNTYDVLNRLTSTTNPLGITVSYTYDKVGNRLTVTDGNGHTAHMAYDGLGRNTRMTPVGASAATEFVYNARNKISRTDDAGRNTTYTYDLRDRLVGVSYATPGDVGVNSNRTYSYDPVGNLLSVSEPGKLGIADVACAYDSLNRVTSETSGGVTHQYHLDFAGNTLRKVRVGSATEVVTVFDKLNRPISVSQGDNLVENSYDAGGNLLIQETRVVQGANITLGPVTTRTFDALNRLISLDSTVAGYGQVASDAVAYDAAGNVVEAGGVASSYDAANRLAREEYDNGAQTVDYSYDNGNNRLGESWNYWSYPPRGGEYTYNAQNQLVSVVYNHWVSDGPNPEDLTPWTFEETFAYDANGNRCWEQFREYFPDRPSWGEYTWYWTDLEYDAENRLVRRQRSWIDSSQEVSEYAYDYRTRRIRRTEQGAETKVVFAGGTSAGEYDENGQLEREFVRSRDFGGGVGGLLFTMEGDGARMAVANHRGDLISRVQVIGGDSVGGEDVATVAYEGFGRKRATSGGLTVGDQLGANTKDQDPTGLINDGFRYRDPIHGVFLTRDPLGFVDGPNVYTYVVQNPWTSFDPLGLETTEAGAEVTRKQHHVVPVETWDKNKLSKEVQENLNEVRIGKEGVNHGGAGHKEYNKRADQIVKDYIKKNGDPSGLTAKDARAYADGLVKEFTATKDAYVRGFNAEVRAGRTQAELAQWGMAMRQAESKASKLGIVLEAGATIAKWGARGAMVLTVAGIAADTVNAGPAEAAENFVKSATFYDVTVQPMGDWFNKTYDQMEHGQLNDNSPIGHNLNEKRRLLDEMNEQ